MYIHLSMYSDRLDVDHRPVVLLFIGSIWLLLGEIKKNICK